MNFGRFYLLCLILLFSSPSFGAVITTDWKVNEDNLMLLDTNSSMEWLNLSQTSGISYSAVLKQLETGGAFEGFRVAKLNDLVQLFGNFGLQLDNPHVNTGYFLNEQDTGKLLNIIDHTGSGFYAYYDHTFFIHGLGELVKSTSMVPDFNTQGYLGFDSGWLTDEASFGIGTWLVRDATSVSEPSLIYLLGISLGFFMYIRQKKIAKLTSDTSKI